MRERFEKNADLLQKKIQNHVFLTPLSMHHRPDGSFDRDLFKEKWNRETEDFEKIKLWEKTPGFDGRDPLQEEPSLIFVPAPKTSACKKTILVVHGGGFQIRTPCEGPNVAWHFHEKGYHTAILSYRLFPYGRMDSLADMQRAVRRLKSLSGELGTDGTVIAMGFSAGGMLCSDCAVHFDYGNPKAEDPAEKMSCRPDAVVCGYGAITLLSFPLPFGTKHLADESLYGNGLEEQYYLAAEKHIRTDTPPFFIWQTLSDDGRFGMELAKALQDAGVSYELHIFDEGIHGIGIGDGENDLGLEAPHMGRWTELCDEWIRNLEE